MSKQSKIFLRIVACHASVSISVVAVKDNLDVFYFAVIVPLHMYFDDNGHMDKRDFLQLWQEIPEQNEQNYTFQNTMNFSAGMLDVKTF
uniref:Beta-adaptin appendage C-terminal subdomain domain-containing protein n=1 Tax=Panagrolaimus davidi TaxID=227884 RepID=A0A914PLB1_9BILA